jgi:hypothetical protein
VTNSSSEHHVLSGCASTFVVGGILFFLIVPHLIGWLADGITAFGGMMRAVFGS